MSLSPVFHGQVSDDGRLLLVTTEQALRRVHLRRLAGKAVEVTIRRERTKRSIDQNSYIHGVPVTILADHFGYTIPEMKLVLMGECFGWKPDAISGREIPAKPSTSDMTVEDCSYFIDWIIPWALTNHGVSIPLPSEVDIA